MFTDPRFGIRDDITLREMVIIEVVVSQLAGLIFAQRQADTEAIVKKIREIMGRK